jgi:small subunit ribosomal protein S2
LNPSGFLFINPFSHPGAVPVSRSAQGIRFRPKNTDKAVSDGAKSMANALVQDLIDAGVHFGHRASRWNPKMAPYIYGRKNQIHIMDIRETVRGLLRAKKYVAQVASGGSLVLFVGTKRQASAAVQREAERCGMPFVSERWLGGALTNFRTIRSRMGRLEELEEIRGGDKLAGYSKKAQSSLNREYRKIHRNLNGMRTMNRKPECLIIVDPNKEKNAVLEARNLGITTVSLIDTNCNPDLIDLPIPGNDDGIRSIELIMSHMADAVLAGRKNIVAKNEGADKAAPAKKAEAIPDKDAEVETSA